MCKREIAPAAKYSATDWLVESGAPHGGGCRVRMPLKFYGAFLREIPTAFSYGRFLRRFPTRDSYGVLLREIPTAFSYARFLRRSPTRDSYGVLLREIPTASWFTIGELFFPCSDFPCAAVEISLTLATTMILGFP